MADIQASSAAGGNGCRLDWELHFDDTANTVTVTATHTRFDGSSAPDPQQAEITLVLNSSVNVSLNLLTGRLSNNQPFDGTATKIINSGPRTRTNVRLRVSQERARLIEFSTSYLPPA